MKTNFTIYLRSSLMVLFLCLGLSSWGQLLQWNTFGNTGSETTEPSVYNNANIVPSNLTLGAGVIAATNGNRFGGSNWSTTLVNSISNNDYIEFIVTPNFGFTFTATSFVFHWDSSGTGPKAVALRSSLDSFANDLGTITPAAMATANTINISGITNVSVPITFRLYGYSASASTGTGGFDIGSNIVNVQLIGTTSSINPTLSVTPSEISGLNYGLNNGPSASQSFVLSGENLDGSEDVTLLADTGFELSLDDTGFDDELTLTAYDGANTTVYVRMASGLAVGVHSGIVFIDGYGVEEEVTVSGTVLSLPVVTGDIFTGTVGVAFSEQIIATENPTSYAILSGTLPNGLTFNTETGLISGTPTVAGNEFEIEVTATNAAGTSAADSFLFDIEKGIQTVTGLTDINAYFGDADITLPAITEQGISIEYISNNESVATVSGNILSIVGLGTTTILAGNDGDANYTSFTDDFTITVTEAPEEYAGVGTFQKITSMSDLEDGYYVIIEAHTNANAMTNSHNGTFLAREAISPAGDIVENPHTGIVWYIETNGNGHTIYNEVTEKYVSYTGSSNNIQVVDAVATDNQRWTITYSDEEFHFNNASLTNRKLQYNSNNGQERFAAYTGSQKNLLLYKLTSVVTWTGTAWINGTPSIDKDVVIEGDLFVGTDITNLEAKTLTVASGGAVYIESENSVTVAGVIDNQAGANNFIVESGANLVQNDDVVNTGAITVEVKAMTEWFGYNMFSSPVAEQTFAGFSPDNGGEVYTYSFTDDTNHGYATASGTVFQEGLGYLFAAPYNGFPQGVLTEFTGEFVGVPHNGTVSIPVGYSFTALGNPYPSAIDANDFLVANTNVGTLYFWTNAHLYNSGDYPGNNYATFTTLAGTGTNGFPMSDNLTIEAGQGFLAGVSAGNVVFNNTMRVGASDGQFYKTMEQEKHILWLNLANENTVLNQIALGYADGATEGVDAQIDGKMFGYAGSALYSIITGEQDAYAIQGRSLPFTNTDAVALGFRAVQAGTYTVSLADFNGLFADGQDIYLKDNATQTYHDLKEAAYTFVSDQGVFESRFEVVYQADGGLNTNNPTLDNKWIVYSKDNGFQIEAQGFEMKEVLVYDMLGRLVYNNPAEGTSHAISNIANGVLIVKVITTDNQVLTRKTAK